MADTRCYRNNTSNGQWRLSDISDNSLVCPGTQQEDGFSRCCGKSAICLPNNICQALNIAPGASGFYVGSCTDRDYNSPACSNFCSGILRNEIVYNETSGSWQCCGGRDGHAKCEDPTRRSSNAPAPSILLADYSASRSTFTATSTSSISSALTLSPTSSPTSMTTSGGSSGGLSTGAKIGAGIGGALGGLLVIALIVFLVMKRRRKSPSTQRTQHGYQEHHGTGESYNMAEQDVRSTTTSQPAGYPSPEYKPYRGTSPTELSAPDSGRAELPTSGPQKIQPPPQELPP